MHGYGTTTEIRTGHVVSEFGTTAPGYGGLTLDHGAGGS